MTTRNVSEFGALADGNGLGGGTDNSTAFQLAADWLSSARGGVLDFSSAEGSGWYRQDEPVSLLHPDNSQYAWYSLLSNGSRIDASNMSGSDIAWTIGGSSINQLVEVGGFKVDLKIKGPEMVNYHPSHTPITSSIGFKFQFCSNVDLEGIAAHGFRTGIETLYCLHSRGHMNVDRNYIGWHLDSVSNHGKHDVHAVNCRTSVAMYPTNVTNLFDKGKINGVKISQFWTEGSDVALWIDGGSVEGAPIVFGIELDGPAYVAQMKKSAVRMGYSFSMNTSSNATSPGEISNIRIGSKFWNAPDGGYAAGRHAIDIAPGGRVSNVEVDLPIPWLTSEAFNNRPCGGAYRLWGSASTYRGAKYVHFDASGNIVGPVNG